MPPVTPYPLIFGITGHRDPADEAALRAALRTLLESAQKHAAPVYVLSALADGADRIAADVAKELNIGLIAIAPMPLAEYLTTLDDPDHFHTLWNAAELRIELPKLTDAAGNPSHKLQYEQLGGLLARTSHVLLALWDGHDPWPSLTPEQREEVRGGTGHVIHLRGSGDLTAEGFVRSRLFETAISRLDPPGGGPVLHIVTPRRKTGGAVAGGHPAGRCLLLPEDGAPGGVPVAPDWPDVVRHLPPTYALAVQQMRDLNHDIGGLDDHYAEKFREQLGWLRPAPAVPDLTGDNLPLLERLRAWQAAADTVAQEYQHRLIGEWEQQPSLWEYFRHNLQESWHERRWRRVGALTLYAGLIPFTVALFALYTPPGGGVWALCAYLVLIAVGVAHYQLRVKPGAWQNRFQDDRALAEAMRVQISWALSGLPAAVSDNYLCKQRDELGWIPFALRGPAVWAIALALRMAAPARQLVNAGWIDGQWAYFVGPKGKLAANRKALAWSRRWSAILYVAGFGLSVALVVLEAGLGLRPTPWIGDALPWLLVVTATAPGLAAFLQLTAEKRAYEAHAHAYAAMGRLFTAARAEAANPARTGSDAAYRALVLELGREALIENAEWLGEHRRREISSQGHT